MARQIKHGGIVKNVPNMLLFQRINVFNGEVATIHPWILLTFAPCRTQVPLWPFVGSGVNAQRPLRVGPCYRPCQWAGFFRCQQLALLASVASDFKPSQSTSQIGSQRRCDVATASHHKHAPGSLTINHWLILRRSFACGCAFFGQALTGFAPDM
jgi:hypothetical protein